MTNQERYKRAFGTLHASEAFSMEEQDMKNITETKGFVLPRAAVAAIAGIIVATGSFSAAYAADVGGLRETVGIWIHGEEQTAVVEQTGDEEYTVSYQDEDGQMQEFKGYGVEMDGEGEEKPLSLSEFAKEAQMSASVESDADGRIWLYYFDQKVDITDRFDENGVCEIQLEHDGEPSYFVIEENGDGDYRISQSSEGYVYMESPEDTEK